jgi:hypothetical protein
VHARFAPTLVASALTVTALTGCTFTAEIANLQPYDPSDGVATTMDDIAVRNAMLITSDGAEANLVMTVVNTTGENVDLRVQYGSAGARQTDIIALPADPELFQVGSDPANQLIISDDDIVAGSLFPVYFQHGDAQGEIIEVPVLDGTLAEYELLVP